MTKRYLFSTITIISFILIFFACGDFQNKQDDLAENGDEATKEVEIQKPPLITMKIAGDILTTRKVFDVMRGKHFGEHFKFVKPFLSDADLTFGNFENPVSELGKPTDIKRANITFRAPTQTLFSLLDGGFDIVSLANNHMMDYGPEAMFETMDLLDLVGIDWVGAGANEVEARKPRYVEVQGKTLAFLAYCDKIYGAILASEDSAGPPQMTREVILEDVAKIKEAGTADYIFVSLHWGPEMMIHHDRYQVDWAHEILDTGADMIIGHHPHVLQGIEFYKGKPIIYSLGNFSFDMDKEWPETYRSMIVSVGLGETGVERFEVYPVRIPFYKYYPTMAEGEDAQEILKDIIDRSSIYFDSPFRYGDGFIYVNQDVLAKGE